jgi:hypothetical protein
MLMALVARQVICMWNLRSINNTESVLQTASVIEEVTRIVTVSVFFLLNHVNRRKVQTIFSKLATFDGLLVHINSTYRQSLFCIVGQMVFHLIFFGSVGIAANIVGVFNVYSNFLISVSFTIDFLIVLMVDLEITNLVLAIKQRFSVVNIRLEEVSFEYPVSKRCIHKPPPSHVQSGPRVIQVTPFVGMSSIKLKNLTELHDFLCDISELVNSTYSIHLLFDVMLKFVSIIFNVYFRLLRVLTYNKDRYEGKNYEEIMVAMLIWNVLQLTALVWACKSSSEEVSLSVKRKIIHNRTVNFKHIEFLSLHNQCT